MVTKLQAVRCRKGLMSPMRTDEEVLIGHNIARVGCSTSVVGPCIACSLRSRVVPAPEILCFAPLSIVMKQWLQLYCNGGHISNTGFGVLRSSYSECVTDAMVRHA